MMNDYSVQYKKICSDQKTAEAYNQRLVKKLGGFNRQDILDGYDIATEESPKFLPTIPDLFAHVKTLDDKRKQAEKNKIEADNLSKLPAPKHEVNVSDMLKKAKSAVKSRSEDKEARLRRLDELKRNHDALLELHSRDITTKTADSDHLCNYSGCRKAGALSHGLKGGDNFYCIEHFRMH